MSRTLVSSGIGAQVGPHGQLPTAAAREELVPGSMVGEYRVEQSIGVGGMGTVYGARHPVIGKRAAIKVLNAKYSADQEAVARFVQEAQAVNQIGHANIVDIFAFGTLDDGRCYFVMEWLQGETLGQRIARGPLSLAEAIAIVITLTRALEAAHSAGVIHRDLKPENVFLVEDPDEAVRLKLLDFGIAKLSTPHGNHSNRTATGVAMGTPLFMSPEQARGGPIDGRTDIYSLGVLTYAMLCGVTPFEQEASPVEVLGAHIAKAPRRPRELRPDVSAALEELILALLAKHPGERPPLGEVRRRLIELAPIAGQPQDLPVTFDDDDFRPARPRRKIAALVIGAVALALGGAELYITQVYDSDATGGARSALAATPPHPSPVPVAPAVPPPAEAAPTAPEAPSPTPPAAAPVEPASGVLDLAIQPAGAIATIDGTPATLVHGHAQLQLGVGEHQISIRAPGHRTQQQAVEIAADHTASLTVRLAQVHTPAPAKPRSSTEPDSDAVVNPFHH